MADTSLIFSILAKDKTKEGFDKVKGAAAAAGIAVGAMLMAAVGAAIDKAKIDAKLAAQLGASPAEAKAIGKLSGKVYADGFGEDLEGVSTAIKAATQNGLIKMKDASSAASKATIENLLTVGQVLEEDTDRVSSAVSQMLRTGLAKSSQEAMDILVTATQKGVNKSQDLLDTVNEYGTQFRKLGLSGTQSMGLLSQAIAAGARDSDTAADALKEFSIRAVDGSKTTAAAFKALGLDGQKMGHDIGKGGKSANEALDKTLDYLSSVKDPVKQAQIATGLFGTKAEDLGKALFAMDPSSAAKKMGDLKGATATASATASAGIASWSSLSRQFQMGLVDTLNLALPAVNAVFGFMQRNSSWVKPLAIGLGLLAVALGIVTAVTWAWNAALAVNPVTWIVLGIVALIAVIVLVATKTTFFQTIWNAVWGFMKGVGRWFAGPFAGFFVTVWNKIVAFAKGVWSAVSAYFGFWYGLMGKVKGWVGGAVDWVHTKWNNLVGFIKGIPGRISGALSSMWNGLKAGFKIAINYVIGKWNSLHFTIPSFSILGKSFGGGTIGVPSIPYMAKGGTVKEQGLAFIHKGETVTPSARVTPFRSSSSGGGGGGATITIKSDGRRMSNLLLELMREAIRNSGGDPVKVLTPR